MTEIDIYSRGVVYCSVCVPKDMTREEVEERVNVRMPAGGTLRWAISKDAHFRGGETNPCKCTQEGRLHYLMEC